MSITYYQNQINQLEKSIADFQKKIADESKKENDKARQIDTINKSINKNTSMFSIQSKQRQVQGYQNEILNCKKKIADYQKQIANKTVELGRKKQELRKAEDVEQKKLQQQQQDFQKRLQKNIDEQRAQLDFLVNQTFSSKSAILIDSEMPKEYDFFISHASEDKNEIVRELAEALKQNGFNVWYDEFELRIGDSLRKSIDNGLINSKYGLVIISPFFIKKNWTEYELNGMIAREMNGHKVILPIWHKVTKNEVLKFSPSLVDKLALNTSIHTIEDIIKALKEL
jgi:flagellar biosynthesis chaperone FliJ